MQQYLDLLKLILNEGVARSDRTGVGTLSVFGPQMRFDLQKGFPLITTKKIFLKGVIHELLWFLKGDTNVKYLQDHGVRIWDEWANEVGDLGPIYGAQWRSWTYYEPEEGRQEGTVWVPASYKKKVIDQITSVIEGIKNDPQSRRHIVTAWNPAELDHMALPPCHCLFQFYVAEGTLSCHLYQRSADVFLGVPFNIASYALLTMMVARVCRLKPGTLVHSFGDAHLYSNHIAQARMQLHRSPGKLPTMKLSSRTKDIFAFTFGDFELVGYNPQPHIAAPIAK